MSDEFTAHEAERLWDASRPSRFRSLGLMAAVGVGLALIVVSPPALERQSIPPWVSVALPWTIFGLIVWSGWQASRRQGRLVRDLTTAREAAELNDWPRVAHCVRRLLGRPMRPPQARYQAYLLYGAAAERSGSYAAGERAFELLLGDEQSDPAAKYHAAIGLAAVKLRTEQLTDAVRLLDRLRRVELPPPLEAGRELVRLFQEVLMGHYDDAISDIDRRRALFRRHLSTRAGYGYGLFAAAFHARGQTADAAAQWCDATLMLPPETLVERYELLRPIAQRYVASERPE